MLLTRECRPGSSSTPDRRSTGARLLVCGAALWLIGCIGSKGSIEGRVFGTDDKPPLQLPGHAVFLLATSSELAAALQSACPANSPEWAEKVKSERERLEMLGAAYGDSARDELAQRRASRRWSMLVRTMNSYRDSATHMDGRPPAFPIDFVEKLALNRVNTGNDGRYVFGELAPGTYLVATELRDEYRWAPVQVVRAKSIADITPRGSRTSCDVARGL